MRSRSTPSTRSEEPATILTENDCLSLLQSREIGRIAFDIDGHVEIFPVNYGLQGQIIVFRTGPGTKLTSASAGAVAFEVDDFDPATGIGWSVVAKGRTEEITINTGRAAEHLRRVPVHPAAPGERWNWMAIKPTEISGRRFHRAPTGHDRM